MICHKNKSYAKEEIVLLNEAQMRKMASQEKSGDWQNASVNKRILISLDKINSLINPHKPSYLDKYPEDFLVCCLSVMEKEYRCESVAHNQDYLAGYELDAEVQCNKTGSLEMDRQKWDDKMEGSKGKYNEVVINRIEIWINIRTYLCIKIERKS